MSQTSNVEVLPAARRADQRKRPSKSLPTDRMKFEVQLRVLQTLGRLSGAGQRAIDSKHLSQAIKNEVSHYTVGLSHSFFVDAGWLEKRGRGDYTASPALLDYGRRVATGSDRAKALEPLAEAAKDGWFWRTLVPQLADGPVPVGEVLVTLMQEAEVGDPHLPQLRALLEWLRYVGLITIEDDGLIAAGPAAGLVSDATRTTSDRSPDEVSIGETDPGDRGSPTPEPRPMPMQPGASAQYWMPETASPAQPERRAPAVRRDSVLSLDVSLQLSAADLAQLSPEQIQALFQAVGTVLALQNRAGS